MEDTTNSFIYNIYINCLEEMMKIYPKYNFFVERDIVWTFQKLLIGKLLNHSGWEVYNDFQILKNQFIDIAVFYENELVFGIEFKYEPSHSRKDIPISKFPVCDWNSGIQKDIGRIIRFNKEYANTRFVALIFDEGSYFADRKLEDISTRIDFKESSISGIEMSVIQTIIPK